MSKLHIAFVAIAYYVDEEEGETPDKVFSSLMDFAEPFSWMYIRDDNGAPIFPIAVPEEEGREDWFFSVIDKQFVQKKESNQDA